MASKQPEFQSSTKLSQIYAEIYKKEFDMLSKPLQERVLKVKADNNLRDHDVDLFVATVCAKSEAIFDDIQAKTTKSLKVVTSDEQAANAS